MINIIIIIVLLILKIYLAFRKAEEIICKPPNVFAQVFAPPGSGKTTLAAKIVRDSMLVKKKVYSNVPIIGAGKFKISDLGECEFEHCTLIIDEAGSELSNRNWHKNLNLKQITFLKKHRHYDVDIWLFSQSHNDVDNKFRELTTALIMLKKSLWIPFKIRGLAIKKTVDLINGQIAEFYEWDKINSFYFFNPKLWAYFNSYDRDESINNKPSEEKYIKLDIK